MKKWKSYKPGVADKKFDAIIIGYRTVQWDATNNAGEPVAAGVYLYMIQAGEFRQTKKMILLK